MSKGILYDATLCIGCKQCEQACATENRLPYNDTIAAADITSANKFTTVLNQQDHFMRKLCMNCDDPACASVCPVGALKKTALGPVTYDKTKCMGCRYCMAACPFGVPKYEWDKAIPSVRKCIMCAPRVAAGKPTACAEICPSGATKFGDREELLEEARKRIHDNPGNYLPHIFGETEVGGTSVLLMSAIPFSTFGFRNDLTERALPLYTYQVLSRIPDFVPLFGTLLGGIYWITHRREDVAAAEAEEKNHKGGAR
jgi:formate dehydrogenase iron-sulfur subunit